MKQINLKSCSNAIISHIPVFLFCTLFVTIYIAMFGEENKIVGVMLLIGLLIFLKDDLGIKTSQGALCIPVIFLLTVGGAHLSLLNPYLGILVNAFSIATILILSSHDLSSSASTPFLLGYIFCQGYGTSGHSFTLRILSVLMWSVLIACIYYIINRKKTYKRSVWNLIQELNIHSTRTQWYIKLTVTLTITMFLTHLFNYPRGIWVSFVVLSVLQPLHEDHSKHAKLRLPATICGTIIFFVLVQYVVPDEYLAILMLFFGFFSSFPKTYFGKCILNCINALFPAALMFSAVEAIIIRIVSNVIGITIAYISNHLFNLHFRSRYDRQLTNE